MESLVIFIACDGPLRTPDDDRLGNGAGHVMRLLRTFEVPVVFVTDQPASEMIDLQRELGACHPFIAAAGAKLYVPRDYFPDVLDTVADEESGWQVLGLQTRGGVGDAVRLLMALYRLGDDPVVFVGLGEDWKDRALLRAVDVPVIVRNDRVDQMRLLRSIPDAYLTMAAGAEGLTEAILGTAAD
jgi:predicted mannosyl-3-phosphoglycerate phosphatase (HAD superfamily)